MPTYLKSVSCGFLRTRDEWGEFSNFRRLDTPIHAGPHWLATSEHLYQACKYASRPDIQERIAAAPRPVDAARIGRNPEPGPDPGWNDRRVDVMRWVIRMKREANPGSIDAALERTAQRPIVEISRHDTFWGARDAGDVYEGENVLGRLWMELRHHIRQNDPLALAEAWSPKIDIGALAPATTRQAPEPTVLSPIYAGIGARQTPARVLEQMTELASWLADRGWHLHSGGAAGADTAFASGALQHERTLFLPWTSFNNHSGPDCHVSAPDVTARHMAIASSLHPAWDRCDATARQFHARNVGILLGPQGETPVDAVVCWTRDGETVGGTPIAIAGTKDDNVPRETVFAVLDAFHKEIPDMYLVHGNAPGTQQIANEWAASRDRPQLTFYPDTRNESLSRAILLRDKQIIDHSPLTVIDFSPADKRTALASMADKKGLNVQVAAELLQGAKQTLDEGKTVAVERQAPEQEQGGGMSL